MTNWTDLERELHNDWKWWTTDELDTTTEVVFPTGLAELARTLYCEDVSHEPLVLPWSTA